MHKGHKFAIQGSGCINADIIIFKISHYPKNGQILTGGKRMTFLKANKIYFQFQSVADEFKKNMSIAGSGKSSIHCSEGCFTFVSCYSPLHNCIFQWRIS